jgi:hypothetical protein
MPDEDVLRALAIAQLQDRADVGGVMFMLCRCQRHAEDPTGFFPVADKSDRDVEVLALVCPSCGETAFLADGKIVRIGAPDEI